MAKQLLPIVGSMNFRVLIYAKGKDFRASLDHSLAFEIRNLSGAPIPCYNTFPIGTLHKRGLCP
jgi:hypothetical protein